MCEGEFESLKAMHTVVPSFIFIVFGWGRLKKGPGCFLLVKFKEVGQQPPDPAKLTLRLAELHKKSISPEGKFGFHVTTCHGNLPQYVGWEENWTVMFSKILSRAMDLDEKKFGRWPKFEAVRQLLFNHVIPRLLNPLQSEGRAIKPCLIHGDIWDENCADDMSTGESFAFDAGSLYAHNDYEIGYRGPSRHRLSNRKYFRAYKKHFSVFEPIEDWDARNLLYFFTFQPFLFHADFLEWTEAGVGRHFRRSWSITKRGIYSVIEDMKSLCRKFCKYELARVGALFNEVGAGPPVGDVDSEEEEEEEDEQEKQE